MTSLKPFSKSIVGWYLKNKRDLPWRNSTDPYHIWLSEIILQQTRVEQGLPYFERFASQFPDVKKFASASEHDILKMWQGLGYYSRARNMHSTAKLLVAAHKGKFPKTLIELKQLKGIGDYTAAAIASFAYNLPHAVVDGNVYRLLSRYFGIELPIDTLEGKKEFAKLADDLLDKKNAAIHNQAIMEIGAIVCKPKIPLCSQCPLALSCSALANKTITTLPVKSKTTLVRHRYFNYFLIQSKNKLIINHRNANDIWKNMYDLPLIETTKQINTEKLFALSDFNNLLGGLIFTVTKITDPIIHKLSHQHLHTVFYTLQCKKLPKVKEQQHVIEAGNLSLYAFPKLIENFLLTEKYL